MASIETDAHGAGDASAEDREVPRARGLVEPTVARRFEGAHVEDVPELVAVEEPLGIVLEHGTPGERVERSLGLTMRTPGHDLDLVLGWLLSEGIVQGRDEIETMRPCVRATEGDVVRVVLRPGVEPAFPSQLGRVRGSSCGVCGRSTIEDLVASLPPRENDTLRATASMLRVLPARLAEAQAAYRHTGGLHAAGLFDSDGAVLVVREDVGRHNALDKLVGACVLRGGIRPSAELLVMSSRGSFEIVQKAARAGLRLVATIGPASSLAIATARAVGMTLAGFLRSDRFNVYTHPERILP